MNTVKEEAAELVEQLPEDATWDDLMHVRQEAFDGGGGKVLDRTASEES